tara:strand:- start:990 stop:1289 length:300 start_codon:yes stop_codon:yes gene_type:complete
MTGISDYLRSIYAQEIIDNTALMLISTDMGDYPFPDVSIEQTDIGTVQLDTIVTGIPDGALISSISAVDSNDNVLVSLEYVPAIEKQYADFTISLVVNI